jgi:hypothetical protein
MRTPAALAAAALLLAALPAPARAGELIRFRTSDGVLGLVDEEEKVPPGALILSRDPKPDRAPSGPTPAEAREETGEGAGSLDSGSPPGPLRAPPPAARLEGAPPGDEAAAVAEWCERATTVRLAREEAEADAEDARERYERCRTANTYCSERDVVAAEERLEDALAEEEALGHECRRADCLPGWVREGCASLP